MDPKKDAKAVCGTCKFSRMDIKSFMYICRNIFSRYYGCSIGYMEGCEKYERGEDKK